MKSAITVFLLIFGLLAAGLSVAADRPGLVLTSAFGMPACDCDNPCPLHASWEKIRETYRQMLEDTRVGDLASGIR